MLFGGNKSYWSWWCQGCLLGRKERVLQLLCFCSTCFHKFYVVRHYYKIHLKTHAVTRTRAHIVCTDSTPWPQLAEQSSAKIKPQIFCAAKSAAYSTVFNTRLYLENCDVVLPTPCYTKQNFYRNAEVQSNLFPAKFPMSLKQSNGATFFSLAFSQIFFKW